MERTDWLDGGLDSAAARFLMMTAITHHQFSSPSWGEHEVRKLHAELAELDRLAAQAVVDHAGSGLQRRRANIRLTAWCFVVNAVSFGFVIASLLSLDTGRLHPVPPVPRRRGQLRDGLRYAAHVPAIARPLLMMALIGAFTFEFEVSLPLLAETTFHGGATSYSWLIGALGAGAVAGGLYAARSARTGVARLTKAALGFAIAIALLAAAPTFPTAVAACVLVGVATVIFLTTGNATIQLASEPDYRGRVTALWSMALVGTTPIGSPIIGALSDVAGPRYALGLGAVACFAAVIVGRWPADGGSGGSHHGPFGRKIF